MATEQFVLQSYESILRRAPRPDELSHYTQALDSKAQTREGLLLLLLDCAEYRNRRQLEATHLRDTEFVPPGHFYSAVPSAEDRQAALGKNHATASVPGINLRTGEQLALLQDLKPFFDECPFPTEKSEGFRYHFANGHYSFGDGVTLYAMMRQFRPRRIIEIGSGFSSALMLDTNDRSFDGQIELTFIEPYTHVLRPLLRPGDRQHTIIERKLQDVDLTVFAQLEANDILFVDSTHVLKLGSDVNLIFSDIIPSLKPGVLIHIHDIFWPFEYPAEWIKARRAWTEAYQLRAFLQYNSEFEILLFTNFLLQRHRPWFEANAPLFLRNPGGNIWLRRQ